MAEKGYWDPVLRAYRKRDVVAAIPLSGGFKGTCDLHTDPGVPEADEWWSATEVGIYVNFGSVEVTTMDEVFNYIRWSQTTETWSIEIVAINMAMLQIPKVVDGVWDLNVSKNLEIEVKPYAARKLADPGFPYWYSGTAEPTYQNRLNLDGILFASSFQVGSNTQYSLLGKTRIIVDNNNLGAYLQYDTLSAKDTINTRSIPLYIGSKSATYNYKGQHLLVDDYNERFTINMTKILFSKGTASKYLALDANKEVVYVDAPGGATPGDYTFDWDAVNSRYAPYAAKIGANPGYPYFYTMGAAWPSYANPLALDGGLVTNDIKVGTISSQYTQIAGPTITMNQGNNKFSLSGTSIIAYSSALSRNLPINIGYTDASGDYHGEYVTVDDYAYRFDINMTKVRFNKGTASRFLAVDANKEVVYTDSPALEVRIIHTENIAAARNILLEPSAKYAYAVVSLYCDTQDSAATVHVEKNSTVYSDFGFSSGVPQEITPGAYLPATLAVNDKLLIALPGAEGRCTFRLILKRTTI